MPVTGRGRAAAGAVTRRRERRGWRAVIFRMVATGLRTVQPRRRLHFLDGDVDRELAETDEQRNYQPRQVERGNRTPLAQEQNGRRHVARIAILLQPDARLAGDHIRELPDRALSKRV